jgi:hypothetical protein
MLLDHQYQFCVYHQQSVSINSTSLATARDLNVSYFFLISLLLLSTFPFHQEKDQILLADVDCNVYRDDMEAIKKARSFGILVTFLSCGVTIAFDECIRAEGMRSVTRHLLRALHHGIELLDAMLYDTACTQNSLGQMEKHGIST